MRFLLSILIFFAVATGVTGQANGRKPQSLETVSPSLNNDEANALEMKMYPNPVTGKRFTIELPDNLIQEIRILNIAGVTVYQKKFQIEVDKFEVTLDNFSNGVYLAKVTAQNKQSKTLKLVVRNQ